MYFYIPINIFEFEKTSTIELWKRYSNSVFLFWAPNSDRVFGLTEAKFEANSSDFHHLTQNFRNFKQKIEIVA